MELILYYCVWAIDSEKPSCKGGVLGCVFTAGIDISLILTGVWVVNRPHTLGVWAKKLMIAYSRVGFRKACDEVF